MTPPTDVPPVSATGQAVYTAFVSLLTAGLIGVTVRWAIRARTPVPVLMLLGGGLAMLNEPIVDANALVYFNPEGRWTLYTLFEIGQPVWLLPGYIFFFGFQAAAIWWWMSTRAVSRRALFAFFFAVVAVDAAFEHVALALDLFGYYGAQPFEFTGFPLWWAFVNATTPIVSAALVLRLAPRLPGWRLLAIAPLMVIAQAATNAGPGLPVWDALNSELPPAAVWVAGAVTMALCVLTVWATDVLLVHSGRRTATSGRRARPRVRTRELTGGRR